jgi:hypothetical protein
MTDPNRRSGRRKPDSNASLPHLGWFLYAARFTFAHLALCAAAIRLRPAAEIVRFGLAVLCFAHRSFCARLILRRPAADIARDAPFELLPNAASASSSAANLPDLAC